MVLMTASPDLEPALVAYNALPTTLYPFTLPVTIIDHRMILQIYRSLNLRIPLEERNPQFSRKALFKACGRYVPPQPEPLSEEAKEEYDELMDRLRREQEEKEYRRMLTGLVKPTDVGREYEDEYTVDDLKRHVQIIFNVLLSTFACAGAVWVVAGSWELHYRITAAMVTGIVVAVAEVVVLNGYLRRVGTAKKKEVVRLASGEVREVLQRIEISGGGGTALKEKVEVFAEVLPLPDRTEDEKRKKIE
ncbi:hypothetical protein BJ508DRAFT_410823 [Ascobolus immersus RN42]|uniref:Endoplasmic reticulum-based factor for assembly of V-ATPase n=1 Tax=Ascobolus immersus RN42 TaxID=1160509 RepID=A0A3N4IMG0_ASCIM|nr:hypothetical protein BJ508DRAFT_410823 [Ascobolus immersus RN42]